jgi:hypothetical protein
VIDGGRIHSWYGGVVLNRLTISSRARCDRSVHNYDDERRDWTEQERREKLPEPALPLRLGC